MTEDTIFNLASVTKVFTGLSISKLIVDDLIAVSDNIKMHSKLIIENRWF